MLHGALVLWFILTVMSLIFVIYDVITTTPEAGVIKVAWVLVTLYTGPIGLFLYMLSCREPIPGTHEKFIDKLWKQSLGSEVHCLAGDATGIIVAAIVLSFYDIPESIEIIIEYVAGFLFGLLIFQALFMKKMMGGSYIKALKSAFFPEWLSMNMIMAGMIPVMVIWARVDELSMDPFSIHFWGKMSLATLAGGLCAFPINRWLVANGLKHGMTTAREDMPAMEHKEEHGHEEHTHEKPKVSQEKVYKMMWLTLSFLGLGIIIAIIGKYI